MKLGPLSGVVKDALVTAYAVAREGTGLAEAELIIEEVPLLVQCPACQATRDAVSIQQLQCRACGTPTRHVVSGRELEIVALEVL